MKHHSQLFNYILFDYLIPSSMLWIRMVSSSPTRAYTFRCLDTYMFRCLDFPIQIMAVYFLTLNNFDIIYLMITFSWFIGKPQTLSYPLIKFLVNCKNGICPSPAAFSLCHSGPISSIFESLSFTTTLSCLPLSERTRPLSLALPFRDSRGSAETLPGAVWLLQCIWRLVVCCVFAQLCPALCDPTVCSLPSTSVRGISQARILE